MNGIDLAREMRRGAGVLENLPAEIQDKLRWITVNVSRKEFNLYPDDTKEARKVVGEFVRQGFLLKVKKAWDAKSLVAMFSTEKGWTFEISEYKPTTCKLVEKTRIIPATPAREAQPERTVVEKVIVCEGTELKDS